MTQLTKGMYGREFGQESTLFGLHFGQMCVRGKMTHNSGWYNKAGEKLGWGDLSVENMVCIAAELEADELFIVLSEGKSYWDHQTNGLPESAPGIAYVAKHAMYVIARGQKIKVNSYGENGPKIQQIEGHDFSILTPREVSRLIRRVRKILR
ncbi:MAG: hypothetical protein A2845_03930 [Candidatus Lloydbacteria bacterium RIFCSPHIGHO2_01_FULL_49_22]|uniref:Uncharacterized protein n=1 Tax=Candidatus Lloydbacteria bacterium RIFCSPHIGHO2_01_FULL_49_22 TaxID=1798658 RepID=A0A1G2CX21_9BACT|nr:MAG: hypothetical protein A2845_03930 [Candidatus Lloydbacteria bacterium RIFCSPHIGHO2_01_FULL_49_22]OGZ09076.1 MAG: hypothetical protein A3C14_03765 [Candidatus Lloydbacteria bacterium RIFCSPHIGHO2_02_FULL_50_18]